MPVQVLRAALAALCLSCLSTPLLAHHVSIDFGPVFGPGSDGDDFGTNTVGNGTACTPGSTGPESCPLTLTNDASSGAIALGFPIDFGNGPVSSLYVNENGVVSFTSGIASPDFSSLSALGQPVIAPYYTDLTSVPFVGTVFEMLGTNFGQLMYQRGSASALPGSDGNFDQADEVPAFSVLWYGPTDSSGKQIFTQIVIYSHAASGSGDFDVRLRYGQNDGDSYDISTAPTAIAGMLLGSNSLSIPGPLQANTDYFYSFRGGKLVGGSTPPPPLTLSCPSGTAQVGTAYSSSMTAAGGVPPYTYSTTGSLPGGLILNASTGAITGTPTAGGTFNFTAGVTDTSGTSAGTASASCSITVSAAPAQLSVSPTSVSFGTVDRYALGLKSVTLTNNGSTSVSLSSVSITAGPGTGKLDFTPLSLCGSKLAPSKSCSIYVLLFANDTGSLSATLNIPNSATGSPQSVPLSVVVKTKH